MSRDLEKWEELQKLFHLAEDEPELDAVLLAACDDPELRRRARALILASKRNPEAPTLSGAPLLNSRIGPYSLVRHLGSGGIGAVYLVERIVGGTIQRAALKVLSLHAAGAFFVERFTREQHILASLDHPNITRMLDAGLNESGEPYLVMEYVEGTHLDAYCDQHFLSIQDRLKLFVHVCDAVAYAHRNLVVHLDLKPSNILVTDADGTVKLLDFGTSKLIQPDTLQTNSLVALGAFIKHEVEALEESAFLLTIAWVDASYRIEIDGSKFTALALSDVLPKIG
jgi:serine/threonine protein kinase